MLMYISDFNQDGKPDNITFMIKRIKVHTLDALKDPAYRFPNNYGVEKYLELFSGKHFLEVFVTICSTYIIRLSYRYLLKCVFHITIYL